MRFITRTVVVLSLVSFFTDVASEMLYPVLLLYLQHIGFTVGVIGVLEGIAEAAAGLSKGYFGHWSDVTGRRLPFVRIGYAISALAKPLMIAAASVGWVLSMRTLDRLGKGIRTGARDALLSDEATPETKGRVFGFHRSMDTLGAVLGPGLALLWLYFHPEDYRTLFLIALVPGLLAIAATFRIHEQSLTPAPPKPVSLLSFWRYLGRAPKAYRSALGGLLMFALFNSSDLFLLLLLRQRGATETQVVGAYILYNLVYAVAAFPLGSLGDRIGLKTTYALGLLVFAGVYAGMALAHSPLVIAGLFCLYGLYTAGTEGVGKAWLTNLVPKTETASAIGTFAAFSSLAALVASSLGGWLWHQYGSAEALLVPAGAAIASASFLMFFGKEKTQLTA